MITIPERAYTTEDVDIFFERVDNEQNLTAYRNEARRALIGFQRYYMARGKNGKTRLSRGRPFKLAEIAKVKELRSMKVPLSFREIGRILNADVRQVYRWYKYGIK